MKTTRHRIRVIALVLVCALFSVVLWTARAIWIPASGGGQDDPSAASASLLSDPWAAPTPAPTGGSAIPTEETGWVEEETLTPEPLFNTFGL